MNRNVWITAQACEMRRVVQYDKSMLVELSTQALLWRRSSGARAINGKRHATSMVNVPMTLHVIKSRIAFVTDKCNETSTRHAQHGA